MSVTLGARTVTFPLEADIAQRVLALCQSLHSHDTAITLDMSLAHGLHFDSLKLMDFFTGIEQLFPGIGLEDWFIEHSSDGRDTLRNAVAYLTRFLDGTAASG